MRFIRFMQISVLYYSLVRYLFLWMVRSIFMIDVIICWKINYAFYHYLTFAFGRDIFLSESSDLRFLSLVSVILWYIGYYIVLLLPLFFSLLYLYYIYWCSVLNIYFRCWLSLLTRQQKSGRYLMQVMGS